VCCSFELLSGLFSAGRLKLRKWINIYGEEQEICTTDTENLNVILIHMDTHDEEALNWLKWLVWLSL
jgi:hypothetical protein